MKFCEDCKHYSVFKVQNGHNTIPRVSVYYICDASNGDRVKRGNQVECKLWRDPGSTYSYGYDYCGPEAKHFEPKITPGADLRKTFGLEP